MRAEEILRDEFWLDEYKYSKVQRDHFVSLIENYNDRDDEIDDLREQLSDEEWFNDDLKDCIRWARNDLRDMKEFDQSIIDWVISDLDNYI